jgi:glycosyltransferase involved in cell wall biosynthesis
MRVLSISSDKKIFEKGSEVRIRTSEKASLISELIVIVFSHRDLHLEEVVDGNLRIIPTNSKNKFFYVIDAFAIGRKLKKIDLISCPNPFLSGFTGLLLKIPLKVNLFIEIHNDYFNKYYIRHSVRNFLRVASACFVVPFSNGIRAVSNRVRSSLMSGMIKHPSIEVLPVYSEIGRPKEGVYTDLHRKYPQFGFIMLSVAPLVKESRLDIAIRAFAESLYMIPDAGFVIVGEGGYKNELIALVANLGISEKVIFDGVPKQMFGYYQSADLFVSTLDYSGYGVTFLEAGFSGCPILSTDVGIMGEVFIDNESALVCPVRDVETMRNKMAEIRKFVDVRGRIASGGKVAARSAIWSKDNYLKRYLKLWKKCR